jgi:acetaldehyde dehydrogenase (acetylating)
MSFADLDSIAEARRCAERGYEAWKKFRTYPPEQVDRIVAAMAAAAERDAGRLAEIAHVETGYGNVEDKRIKNLYNSRVVAEWLANVTTLGVLWRDETTKVVAVGESMGVVAGLIPVTHPTALVIFKVLSAVKAGNAIVCAPHPRGARSSYETAQLMAEAAVQAGAPADLVQCMRVASIEGTAELMRHHRVAVVLATGGAGMVKAAYSSGKPTLAVGPGNVPCYVDRSKAKELDDLADGILTSKNFDHGTGCVCEQAVIADRPVAGLLREAIRDHGGYFCTSSEADALARILFTRDLGIIPENVGQPAALLAERAGFAVPPRTRVLVAEQTGVGRKFPLSAEKLQPVLAFYEVTDADAGYALAQEILRFGGEGHSAALHANDPEVVARFSSLPAGRIFVNTPCMHGGIGYSADVEPSFMLGTGTLSGSITSDNVTAMHLINVKRVAYESRPWRTLANLFERTA